MTSMTTRFSDQSEDLQQLVLFPELADVRSQPLEECHAVVSSPVREQDEGSLSVQQALDAGQLLLFADTIQQGISKNQSKKKNASKPS